MLLKLTPFLTFVVALSACQSGDPDAAQADVSDAATGEIEIPDDAVADSMGELELPARTFRFTYGVEVPVPPEGTEELRIWVPLARTDPGVQHISEPAVVAPPGYKITTDPVYGNPMIYCVVKNPERDRPTRVGWSATVSRVQDVGQGTLPPNEKYLQANQLIPLEGKASAMATDLGVTTTDRPVQARARVIYDDVLDGMIYDKSEPGYGFGDFERSVTICKGNCTDFHSRFIGVGRAAGIPVRFTMGIPLKAQPQGEYNSYHCWAHYHDGTSWHPVDISEADKVVESDPDKANWFFGNLDENRVTIGFGRDLLLEPAQAGAPLNYFVFPYAEADGVELPMDKSMWKFTYKNL